MKLGLLTAILADMTFEEAVDYAAKTGFQALEVACWPNEAATRRYAGVCHIDVDTLTDEKAQYINQYCAARNIFISSLAYYPNNLDEDLEKRVKCNEHLKKVILASEKLGVGMVTTFIGRMQHKGIEENFEAFQQVWKPLIRFAEEHQVKVAIENCPMLFSRDEWPGGQNLAFSPANWKRMFSLIASAYFGLNFDPSHFVWQMMDYVKPVYEFRGKMFHIHFKDIKLMRDKLNEVGVLAYPLEYMKPKIPGLGDIDWGKFVSALTDIGYDGAACIEVEDKAFEKSQADILRSVDQAYRDMHTYC